MDSTLFFSPLYQIDEYSHPQRCSGHCTLCLSTVCGVTIDYSFREYDWNWLRRLLGLQIVEDGGDKSSTVQFGAGIFQDCPLLTTITMHPWKWCDLLSAMDSPTPDNCNFRYKFLRKSQNQLVQYRRR